MHEVIKAISATLNYVFKEALTEALTPQFSAERDLAVLSAMCAELQAYLLKDILYWRMSAPATFPMLTLGGLLLRLHRLTALSAKLKPEERAALEKVYESYGAITREWGSHVAQHAQQEIRARVRLLSQTAVELEAGSTAPGHWRQEAEMRTMLKLLADELRPRLSTTDLAAVQTQLDALDTALRRALDPAPFIGPAELQPVYTPDEFWWWYRRPHQRRNASADDD